MQAGRLISPALEHVVLLVVLDAGIGEVKEEGEGELGGRHAGQGHGHRLGEAEAEDAVDALEVGGVARGDSTKLREGEVVAELHDVVCLVALEGRVVSVLEEKLPVLDVTERLRGAGVKPGWGMGFFASGGFLPHPGSQSKTLSLPVCGVLLETINTKTMKRRTFLVLGFSKRMPVAKPASKRLSQHLAARSRWDPLLPPSLVFSCTTPELAKKYSRAQACCSHLHAKTTSRGALVSRGDAPSGR